jgi:hypothetical protein
MGGDEEKFEVSASNFDGGAESVWRGDNSESL